MFVLTVDQVDSRHGVDRVRDVLDDPSLPRAELGPDRTAGDEFQMLYRDAPAALDAVLLLHRTGGWSIGMGVGSVALPLPMTAREATGDAFVAARSAVDAAKRAPARLAVVSLGAVDRAAGCSALIALLLEARGRRTREGWQVADLMAEGLSQVRIAHRLGVTPQAISLRARAASVRVEQEAVPALVRALAELDAAS